MTRRYDKAVIKALLAQEGYAARVVEHFWPEAEAAAEYSGYRVAEIAGGKGNSCALQTTGDYAGQYHDYAEQEHGDLIQGVMRRTGLDFSNALQAIGDLLGAPDLKALDGGQLARAPVKSKPRRRTTADLSRANREAHVKTVRALEREPAPRAYLHGRGLNDDTITRFGLGIFPDRRIKDHGEYGPVISHPVIGEDGKFLNAYAWTTVEGWTRYPPGMKPFKGACPGGPYTTWDGSIEGKTVLLVVEGMKDQWCVAQALVDTPYAVNMAIASSTHGSAIPAEWKDPDWWSRWHKVYLGHDNDKAGETLAKRISGLAPRDFYRVRPRGRDVKDWTDFFKNGHTVAEFEELLERADIVGLPAPVDPEEHEAPKRLSDMHLGDHADRRRNINGAFVGGMMYYPFKVRVVEAVDENGNRVEDLTDGSLPLGATKITYYATRVIRSDGRILNFRQEPAPAWVPRHERVLTLDDGTEVADIPDPDAFCTWRLNSILDYQERVQARKVPHRPLAEILQDVEAYLKRVVWLPGAADHALLAAYVALSYVYNAFEAIPMMLITGEKGSGKTSLAKAVASLSFNGSVSGAGSEAAIIRFTDQGRGLLVLDDIERVGRPSRNENGLGDINEVLKVSYDKDTAIKIVFEGEGANKKSRRLAFYGPKVLTNITGIDPVNATRMFMVLCRPMPEVMRSSKSIMGSDNRISEPLRQELHCWGMFQVRQIEAVYRHLFPSRTNRKDQISAPLLAICELAGDDAFTARVKASIRAQDRHRKDAITAEDVLREAVDAIIARGARRQFSLFQVMNELALIPEAQMTVPRHQVEEEFSALQNPNRLGRMLSSIGARGEKDGKVNLGGKKARTYNLDPDYLEAALERLGTSGVEIEPEYVSEDPVRLGVAFCDTRHCAMCPYQATCNAVTGLQDGKKHLANNPRGLAPGSGTQLGQVNCRY